MKRPLVPMKAVVGTEKDLDRPGLIFEPKLDGIRALCYVNDELTFYSRNGRNITKSYPEFQFREQVKAQTALFDGEIVVLDSASTPRFSLWQEGHKALYIVFDILAYDGKNLLSTPLIERKKILERIVADGHYIEKCLYTFHGHALWKEIGKRHMEGVMAKEPQSLYYPGTRKNIWIKIKRYQTLDAVIIGYTTKQRSLSSLILGIFTQEGKLSYIGKVGTGFTEQALADLLVLCKRHAIAHASESSLLENIPLSTQKVITWMKPSLVCEIKYLEFTATGVLRVPVFLRMRPDKNAKEVTFKDQGLIP